MAKNFLQPGHVITVPAPAATVAGAIVEIGDLHGIAANSAATGEPLDVETEGVWLLPKLSTESFAVGAAVYHDQGTARSVASSGGINFAKIGFAVEAAAGSATSIKVKLT